MSINCCKTAQPSSVDYSRELRTRPPKPTTLSLDKPSISSASDPPPRQDKNDRANNLSGTLNNEQHVLLPPSRPPPRNSLLPIRHSKQRGRPQQHQQQQSAEQTFVQLRPPCRSPCDITVCRRKHTIHTQSEGKTERTNCRIKRQPRQFPKLWSANAVHGSELYLPYYRYSEYP